MAEFTYMVKKSIDVPDTIKVKGKEIKAYIDSAFYDDGFPPSIEYEHYGDDDWCLSLIADNKGEFMIRLSFNGERVAEDMFYPEDTPIQQMIDRFVETLEGLL